MIESSGTSQVTESVPQSTPQVAEAPSAPVTTQDERTFRQSDVNDIVKRAKHEAVEGYKRIQAEQPRYAEQKYGETSSGTAQLQPNQANLSENDYRRIAAEEAQRLRDQWVQEAHSKSEIENAQRIVEGFKNKISSGKEKYPDFDQVTGVIEYAKFPNVVQLLAQYVENADDVLYHFANDEIKMETLESLASRSPQAAIRQAQRLAASLKANANAKNIRVPNEPLSQLRPSNTGTDNGVMSVGDYRKKYKV
jgi:hypothetical protein